MKIIYNFCNSSGLSTERKQRNANPYYLNTPWYNDNYLHQTRNNNWFPTVSMFGGFPMWLEYRIAAPQWRRIQFTKRSYWHNSPFNLFTKLLFTYWMDWSHIKTINLFADKKKQIFKLWQKLAIGLS